MQAEVIVVQFEIERLRLLRNLPHYLEKAPNSAGRLFNFIPIPNKEVTFFYGS